MKTIMFIFSLMLSTTIAHAEILGKPIPQDVPRVKLQEILKSPEQYKDKDVVLEGNYGFYCCAEDFSYKEGTDSVEISPAGFENKQLKPGTPVRIWATVRVRRGDVHPEAKGMETK